MIRILPIVFTVSAHMHMTNPLPKYQDPFNANAPSNLGCTIFPPNTGALAEKVNQFNAAQGQRPLRDFVDDCYAQTGNGKKCGSTDPNHVVTASDGRVTINVGADHVGPSAIYLDDQVLHTNTGIQQNTFREHDFGDKLKCKKANGCLLRFVQVALHVSTPEIYDNCVRLSGTGEIIISSQQAPDTVPNLPDNKPISNLPIEPTKTNQKPSVDVTRLVPPPISTTSATNSDVWTCDSAGNLVRIVVQNGLVSNYVFECAPGTICKSNGDFSFCEHNSK